MEKDEAEHTRLEDAIIARDSAMQVSESAPDDPIKLDFDQWDDFLDLCHDLGHYYQDYADTVIGVEVIRVYADLTRYLRSAKGNEKITEDQRFDLEMKLAEVEGWMDYIIAQAAKNWEYLNTENDK